MAMLHSGLIIRSWQCLLETKYSALKTRR